MDRVWACVLELWENAILGVQLYLLTCVSSPLCVCNIDHVLGCTLAPANAYLSSGHTCMHASDTHEKSLFPAPLSLSIRWDTGQTRSYQLSDLQPNAMYEIKVSWPATVNCSVVTTCARMRVCARVCMCVCACACACTCVSVFLCVFVCVCMCLCVLCLCAHVCV